VSGGVSDLRQDLDPVFEALRQVTAQHAGEVMAALHDAQRLQPFERRPLERAGIEAGMHQADVVRQAVNGLPVEQSRQRAALLD
jgi:hypothetical protein